MQHFRNLFIVLYWLMTVGAVQIAHPPCAYVLTHFQEDYVCTNPDQPLGKGSFGVVYKIQRVRDSAFFALKVTVPKGDDQESIDNEQESFEKEANILWNCRHPNLVGLVAATNLPVGHAYIMELVYGSDLRGFINWNPTQINVFRPRTIFRIFQQILDGVEALHNCGYVHRDLKPENIMWDGQVAKIIDLGFALPINQPASDLSGTHNFMDPLVVYEHTQTLPVTWTAAHDIFGLGVVLYEMNFGKSFYPALQQPYFPYYQALENRPIHIPQYTERVMAEVISGMTLLDYDARMSIADAKSIIKNYLSQNSWVRLKELSITPQDAFEARSTDILDAYKVNLEGDVLSPAPIPQGSLEEMAEFEAIEEENDTRLQVPLIPI